MLFSVSALVLAACGGDPADPTAATPDPDPPAADSAGDGNAGDGNASDGSDPDEGGSGFGPTSGGSGTMTVDGETLDVDGVIRCIPFDASEFGGAEGDPNELDIVILGGTVSLSIIDSTTPSPTLQGETYDRSVNRLTLNRGNDQYENVAASLPDGTWVLGNVAIFADPGEGTPIDGPAFTVDGNNIRGAMTLEQNWPEGADGKADVAFDVVFPSEEMDCSL